MNTKWARLTFIVSILLAISSCSGGGGGGGGSSSGGGDGGGGGGGGGGDGGGTTYPSITWTADSANWTVQSSSPMLASVAVGTTTAGATRVAVGTGLIYRQVAAGSWTALRPTGHNFLGVAFGGGRFVAITNDATTGAWVSDGTTDGMHALPCAPVGIVHNGTQFVLACGNASLYTSTDGIAWTLAVTVTGAFPSRFAYVNSTYVVLDRSANTFFTASSLAGPWTQRACSGSIAFLSGVAWDGTNYVFVANDQTNVCIGSSLASLTVTSAAGITTGLIDVQSDGATLIASPNSGSTGFFTSTDSGANWTPQSTPVAVTRFAKDGSTFYAAGDMRWVLSGPLATLTEETGTGPGTEPVGTIAGFASSGNDIVAASNSRTDATAAEGLFYVAADNLPNWILSYTVPAIGFDNSLGGVFHTGTKFAAWGGNQLAVHESANGQAPWTTTRLAPVAHAVVHDNNQYWMAGEGGMILSGASVSADLTVHKTGATDTLNAIAAAGFYFTPKSIVAVGNNGAIVNSTDNGVTWSNQTYSGNPVLTSVTFGATNGAYVAVGNGNVILYADADGATWTAVSSPPSANYTQVIFDGAQFVAVGSGSTVVTGTTACSPGCAAGTWTAQSTNLPGGLTLVGVAKVVSTYMVVTSAGVAYTSTNLTAWTAAGSTGMTQAYSITASQGLTPNVFAISGYGKVVTSIDGASWTTVANPSGGSIQFNQLYGAPAEYIGVSFYNGLWLSSAPISWAGGYGSATQAGAVTWDGTKYVGVMGDRFVTWNGSASSWTAKVVTLAGSGNPINIASNGTGAVAVTNNGSLLQTTYGSLAWTSVSSTALGAGATKVFHAGGKYLASIDAAPGTASGIPTSTDGVTWSAGTLYEPGPTLDDLTYDGTKFVAAGCTQSTGSAAVCGILVSADGVSWTGYDFGLFSYGYTIAPLATGYMVGGWYGLTATRAANY